MLFNVKYVSSVHVWLNKLTDKYFSGELADAYWVCIKYLPQSIIVKFIF